MTPEVREFIKSLRLKGPVLEVGSMDVNGSVRDLFPRYVGLDLRQGKNVDVQASGHALPFKDGTFAGVLCLETLEHDSEFWLTVPELKRVLRKGGHLVITVPGIGFPHHDHPFDFYRFTADAVARMFTGMRKAAVAAVGNYAWTPPGMVYINGQAGVFAHGIK